LHPNIGTLKTNSHIITYILNLSYSMYMSLWYGCGWDVQCSKLWLVSGQFLDVGIM